MQLILLCAAARRATNTNDAEQEEVLLDRSADSFLLIGVSGGLQEGFPAHTKLDYHEGQDDESKAIFLGRALVRGYKPLLDVMQEGESHIDTLLLCITT
jgi:hypothetical protein